MTLRLSKKPLIIAIVGKGGVGKTIITSLLARSISDFSNYKMLLIDADPTHPHLSNMVNLHPNKSLEEIRLNAVKNAAESKIDAQSLAENIDFNVYEGLAESKKFCLFSIGQPEGPGCFCPSNLLLRKVIESISKDFDLILIDCEAGLEQINRMVINSIDILLIVTDLSMRSIETADSIRKSAKKFTNYTELGVIINKVKGNIEILLKKLKELDLAVWLEIPEVEKIIEYDLEGKPIIELPDEIMRELGMDKLVEKILG
ncbi:MAG: AAA family ATPase [Promethearchaeota archaeon]